MHRPPLPPGNTPGTHFYKRQSRPQGHSVTDRIMSLKNSNDIIGNRTHDLQVCSLNHYATARPCGPEGSRRFRLPESHDIRHMKLMTLSVSRTGRLYPQECSWYSFSLGAESTPGPWRCRKEICH
jgi:hypothetical protein